MKTLSELYVAYLNQKCAIDDIINFALKKLEDAKLCGRYEKSYCYITNTYESNGQIFIDYNDRDGDNETIYFPTYLIEDPSDENIAVYKAEIEKKEQALKDLENSKRIAAERKELACRLAQLGGELTLEERRAGQLTSFLTSDKPELKNIDWDKIHKSEWDWLGNSAYRVISYKKTHQYNEPNLPSKDLYIDFVEGVR